MDENILEIKDLKMYFTLEQGIFGKKRGPVKAVDGVTFSIRKGESIGLVGESGCGKTTLAQTILGLNKPTNGDVLFNGRDISKLSKKDSFFLKRQMQLIFQDPFSSLNPRMKVFDVIGEAYDIHKHAKGDEKRKRVLQLIEKVGLDPYHIHKYPHELSGGERQRIAIARALAIDPIFLVADEPVSALDISVRAQILNILKDLIRDMGITFMLISHDMSVVRYMCDRTFVLYLGKLVEVAPTKELLQNPRHPYVEALLSAIPVPDPLTKIERILLPGEPPSPIDPPSGCRFHPRCPVAEKICSTTEPNLESLQKDGDHFVACHFAACTVQVKS
jgi:oligopeptide/dipeptide ABC transporter ATP-binding protein